MDEPFSVEIAGLLDQLDTKSRAVEDRKRRVKADQDDFDQAFARAMATIVKPAFAQIGALLTKRGHQVSISEEQPLTEPGVAAAESGISLRIAPGGSEAPLRPEQVPWLTIATRHYNKSVSIRSGNLGSATSGATGPHGDYPLEKFNLPLVESELLKFIRAIVASS